MSDYTKLSRDELIRQLELQERLLQHNSDADALTHELQTYQIELEMQNRDLREKQQELELARDKYADLYDFSPIGYLTLDDKGVILEANLTAANLLQQTRAYILNRPFIAFLTNGDSSNFHSSLKLALNTGDEQSVDLRIRRSDESNYYLHMQFRASKNNKGENQIRTAIIDITEKKRAERELMQSKIKAVEASQAKSRFLARMSHELRTPLNSILGFAQLLDLQHDDLPAAKVHSYIDQILIASRHLVEVINDVLDLSKVEADKLEVTIENVDLIKQIQACIDIVLPLAKDHNINIEFNAINTASKIVVRAEKLRLKQILLNLLSNAIKYNRDDGSVTVECKPVDNQRVKIVIIDSGLGIATENFPEVFEPFNRLYLDTYAQQGTGIGLTISKQLIELMGGTIGFESQLGKGSSFWIELELSPAETEPSDDGEKPRLIVE